MLVSELLPYLVPRAHGSQYKGLPARNTEMATHHARTIMLNSKRERQAFAALFIDVKNAFPSLAHVMVVGEQNLERRIAKVDCLVQELPEQYRARERDFILEWLDGGSALQRHAVVCGSRRGFSRCVLCERHEARRPARRHLF